MRKPPPPTIPDPREWDFRSVGVEEIEDCVCWEYARTSARRHAIETWLRSKVGGVMVKTRLTKPGYGFKPGRTPDCARMVLDGWTATGAGRLHAILMLRGWDISKPWLAGWRGTNTVGVKLPPVEVTPIDQTLAGYATATEFAHQHPGRYVLTVNWRGQTIAAILGHLREWLAVEAKQHPELRKRGGPGHAPVDDLTSLSAFRLRAAGFTFESARSFLSAYVAPHDRGAQADARSAGIDLAAIPRPPKQSSDGCGRLPMFADIASWSDAIRRAKTRIAQVELGMK